MITIPYGYYAYLRAFTPFSYSNGFNNVVYSIISTTDTLYVGGNFTTFALTSSPRIEALNLDGSNKSSFNIGTGFNGIVYDIATNPSTGKIFVVGGFTSYSGVTVNRLSRLNTGGILEPIPSITTGFDQLVFKILFQPDGKMIVIGAHSSFNADTTRPTINRFNVDLSLDTAFKPLSITATMKSGGLLSDGSIIIGGGRAPLTPIPTVRAITKISPSGVVDSTFYSNLGGAENYTVNVIEIQNDNKILFGGSFNTFNGVSDTTNIKRLNPDGTVDTSFTVGTGFNGSVNAIKVLPSGKILVGGAFTSYNGTPIDRLALINSNGILDSSLDVGVGFNSTVNTILLAEGNTFFVGGAFTTYKGVPTERLSKLDLTGALISTMEI